MAARLTRLVAIVALSMFVLQVHAQSLPPTAPSSTPSNTLLKAEELDQLVAPIALYPDTFSPTS